MCGNSDIADSSANPARLSMYSDSDVAMDSEDHMSYSGNATFMYGDYCHQLNECMQVNLPIPTHRYPECHAYDKHLGDQQEV